MDLEFELFYLQFKSTQKLLQNTLVVLLKISSMKFSTIIKHRKKLSRKIHQKRSFTVTVKKK